MAAFLSATILPAQSEVGLAASIVAQPNTVLILIIIASLGNTLGALVNWYLGRNLKTLVHKLWFPVTKNQLAQATTWYKKYGLWSLLLTWVPIIGDPLTLIAGLLRAPLFSFLLIVGFTKTVRYVVVAKVALNWV